MSTSMNIFLILCFGGLAAFTGIKALKTKGKIIVPDKSWSGVKIGFTVLMILIILTLFNTNNTTLDYIRILIMIFACMIYITIRDGVGEEGIVHNGNFTAWKHVRGWDKVEKEKKVEVYFQIDSTNEKKPDKYKTVEIDFDPKNRKQLDHFMEVNCRGKYMRMKKR